MNENGFKLGAEADNFFVGGTNKISQWIKRIFDQNNGGVLIYSVIYMEF